MKLSFWADIAPELEQMNGDRTMKKHRPDLRKRGKGAWTIGHFAAQVTGDVFERHGLGRGEIVHAWPHIVGARLALVSRPERLAPRQKGAKSGGTLHVVTSGAHAIDLHYAAERIISGVNALYGHQVVSRIKVKTAVLTDENDATGHSMAMVRPTSAPPGDPNRFGDIRTPALRCALARLEAGILAEDAGQGIRQKRHI